MMHPTEDQLLSYAIGALSEEQRRGVEAHLATCAACQALQAEISAETELLAGVRLDADRDYPPLPRAEPRMLPQWARLAAVLVLGFVGGALASTWWRPDAVLIVPMPRIESTRVTLGTQAAPGDVLETRNL